MKTTKTLTLAIVACGALGASALADQTPGQQTNSQRQVRSAAESSKTMESGKPWNQQPMVVRTVAYPFLFLERTGRTIVRSPEIVSETIHGDRLFLSRNGIFAQRETERPSQRIASAPAQSVANNRG